MNLLTSVEAARHLRVCTKTLQNLRRQGLQYVRLGRSIRYRESDLIEFVEANLCRATPTHTTKLTIVQKPDGSVVGFKEVREGLRKSAQRKAKKQ